MNGTKSRSQSPRLFMIITEWTGGFLIPRSPPRLHGSFQNALVCPGEATSLNKLF